MDKFVKFVSQQSPPFTSTQNLVDFVVPASGVYDLRDSYINLNCRADVVENSTASGTGIYNVICNWVTADAEKPHFENVAVVKNANIDANTKGRIENIRRVDILRQNLCSYIKSQKEAFDENYLDISQLASPVNQQIRSPFVNYQKTGTIKSQYNEIVPISIRLGDIFDFCNTREFDSDRVNGFRIHLELNRDKLTLTTAYDTKTGTHKIEPEPQVFQCKNVGAGETGNTLVLGETTNSLVVTDINQIPYYVGMKVKVNATAGGGASVVAPDTLAVISSVNWNKETGEVTLGFENNWGSATPLGAGDSYTAITLTPETPASATLVMDGAELVLKRVDRPEGFSQINYNTWATEEVNGNGATNYTQLFTVEPEATSAIFMFPQGNDGLISNNEDIQQWRLRLNNLDLSDRNIVKDSPLANDRLGMTMTSIKEELRNLNRNYGKSNAQTWGGTYTDTKFNTTLVCNPLFQTPLGQMKLLQANITAGGGGVKAVALFKCLPREFTY